MTSKTIRNKNRTTQKDLGSNSIPDFSAKQHTKHLLNLDTLTTFALRDVRGPLSEEETAKLNAHIESNFELAASLGFELDYPKDYKFNLDDYL